MAAKSPARYSSLTKTDWVIARILALLVLLSSAYFYQGGGDNENSRFAQVRSFVEEQVWSIDKYAYRSTDVVRVNGKMFPNKAPGLTILSLPVWKVFQQFLSHGNESTYHFLCYLTTIFTIGLASALLTAAVYLTLRLYLCTPQTGVTIAVGLSLASISFPFSTLYFSHQLAASCLGLAFFLLVYGKKTPSRFALFCSGFALSFAVATEYPTVLGVGAIGLYGLFLLGWRDREIFIAGGIIGLIPLLFYNLLVFWDPLFVPYQAYTTATGTDPIFAGHQQGVLGVKLPSWEVFQEIIIRPQRGLLIFSPWLSLVLIALPLGLFRCPDRRAPIFLSMLIVSAFFIFNAGYGDSITYWGGGASVGPRHIIPALPFMAFIIGLGGDTRWFRRSAQLLIIPSGMIALIAAAVEPKLPYEFLDPIRELYVPNWLRSDFGMNVSGVFGDELITDKSVAFNLGTLIGLKESWALTPLLLLWLFGFLILLRLTGRIQCAPHRRLLSHPMLWMVIVSGSAFQFIPIWYQSHMSRQLHHGLLGECYRGIVWGAPMSSGKPNPFLGRKISCGRRSDAPLNREFHVEGFPTVGPFSMEWEGTLTVSDSGGYLLGVGSDDGSALYMNDQLEIDNWGDHGYQVRTVSKHLSKGVYRIRIRYYNRSSGAIIRLLWARAGEELVLIPAEALGSRKQ